MKVLIGCPTCEKYAKHVAAWTESVLKIIAFSKGIQVDYLLVDNSPTNSFFDLLKGKKINSEKTPYFENVRERIAFSRNILREKVLNENYDYFLSLEQDIIPEKELLEMLLSHKKKIVSAYYGKPVDLVLQEKETGKIKKTVIELPIVYLQEEGGVKRANPNEVLNKGLIKVGGFGVGCVLIHRDVLQNIKFRFEKDKRSFDDLLFCYDAKKAGYDLFLDSDIQVLHLHERWQDGIN